MEIQTYQEMQEYLESFIKPFSAIRSGEGEITPLERMKFLLEKLGNPQRKFRSLVVTGTSGKGSTAYLLSHILFAAGYRIGLTVSPHLEKVNERIQVNEELIADDELVALIQELQPVISDMKTSRFGEPSYFEILSAAAFLYFSRQSIEIAIIEVGLEGKYEASNLLSPLGVVLTNISLDHTSILGDTVERIAQEAVHAINGGVPGGFVISGVRQASVKELVRKRCHEKGMQLLLLDRDFSFVLQKSSLAGCRFDFRFGKINLKKLQLSLLGAYQSGNASLVLTAIFQLRKHGFSVDDVVLRRSLSSAAFSGRFEVIYYSYEKRNYQIILDGAHNEAKMSSFIHSLADLYPQRKKVFVIAFKRDKFIEPMLRKILPQAKAIVVTEFHVTTDMAKNITYSSDEVFHLVQSLSLGNVPIVCESISQKALLRALSLAEENDLVVTTGSLFLVGEIRQYLHLVPV